MRITAGSYIGPYRIDAPIAEGSTGVLYRAYDPRHERPVALKVFVAAEGAGKQEHFARFAREARATAIINHPNLVTVYDAGAYDHTTFVASELLHGETLRAVWQMAPCRRRPRLLTRGRSQRGCSPHIA
jgi:serine/threonine protein kinase